MSAIPSFSAFRSQQSVSSVSQVRPAYQPATVRDSEPGIYAASPRAASAPESAGEADSLLHTVSEYSSYATSFGKAALERVNDINDEILKHPGSTGEFLEATLSQPWMKSALSTAGKLDAAVNLTSIASAPDPYRALNSQLWETFGETMATPVMGPIAGAAFGKVTGKMGDQLAHDDIPLLVNNASGIANETGNIADITAGSWGDSLQANLATNAHYADVMRTVADKGSFVDRVLGNSLADGYQNIADTAAVAKSGYNAVANGVSAFGTGISNLYGSVRDGLQSAMQDDSDDDLSADGPDFNCDAGSYSAGEDCSTQSNFDASGSDFGSDE